MSDNYNSYTTDFRIFCYFTVTEIFLFYSKNEWIELFVWEISDGELPRVKWKNKDKSKDYKYKREKEQLCSS